MAVVVGGSGRERGGRKLIRGAVCLSGRVCHRLGSLACCFVAWAAAVVGSDTAVTLGASGLDMGGWGLVWGAGDRPGTQYHRSSGPGGGSEARGGILIAIVNDIGIVDGSCAAVASGDVAGLVGSLGEAGFSRVGWELSLVCTAVSQVLQSSIDVPMSFSRRGGSLSCVVCMAVLTEVGVFVPVIS
jgi:hypothetical protein